MVDSMEIINNTLTINKDNLSSNIKPIIKRIKESIDLNKDLIEEANNIDLKNNNGFKINFDVIDNIFNLVKKENLLYGTITLSEKDSSRNITYGKEILDIGNVLVINDGHPYTLIEMTIRNIMAGNTTIFCNNGYMYGTNQLLIELIQTILEEHNISKYLVQIYLTEDYEDILNNYANIDLVICIGNHSLQRLVLNNSKTPTIVSGYEHFDLYIEDTTHLDFIKEIINSGIDINIYEKDELNLDFNNSIIVGDIDEAIAQINYNGNRFSSSIFTNNKENASKFIKEVKSKTVTVNTSPTIERILDIKQTDLIREKVIIYPEK